MRLANGQIPSSNIKKGSKVGRDAHTNHAQAEASKLGRVTKAMDKGAKDVGKFTSTRTGSKAGIVPSSVSFNGFPLRTMVWLRRFPSFGVKWYSCLCTAPSDAFFPIHVTDFLKFSMKEPSPWLASPSCSLMFMPFRMVMWNLVELLRLINSKVMPACHKGDSEKPQSFMTS